MKALIPIITFFIIFVFRFSQQADTLLSPHQPQQEAPPNNDRLLIKLKKDLNGNCSYTLNIYTSCSSPKRTRDHISLAFGDKYGHQVYAPRLDKAAKFSRCTQVFLGLKGPCTSRICYLYIYRNGSDGWKPHHVTISPYTPESVSFYFNTLIPNQTWYGFNYCNTSSSSSSSSSSVTA